MQATTLQGFAQPAAAARRPARRLAAVTTAAAWGRQSEQNRLFIFGLGYTGLGAASYFQQRGWEVAGTCRTREKCERLAQRGIGTFHFDPNDYDNLSGKGLDALRHATHVLSTVPPEGDNDIDPVLMAHAQQLSERAEHFRWVGYISSTSVYGDYQGEWVDEGSELRAAGGKGWSRVMAEHEWVALHDTFGLPVHIFRCGGIYGPQRSALQTVERSQGGGAAGPSAARRARQRYTARCHIFDICQTLEASMRHLHPGAAYNIADDDPADRGTVMAYAAELLQRQAAGLPPPGPDWGISISSVGSASAGAAATAAAAAAGGRAARRQIDSGSPQDLYELMTPMSMSSLSAPSASSGSYDSADDVPPVRPEERRRGGNGSSAAAEERPRGRQRDARLAGGSGAVQRGMEEKRVRNGRIKKELGVRLAFPTYREGLAAIAAGDMRPFE